MRKRFAIHVTHPSGEISLGDAYETHEQCAKIVDNAVKELK